MALLSYKITNRSKSSKIFTYFSGSSSPGNPFNITVPGLETRIVESYIAPIFTPGGVSENNFLSDSYIPPTGTAYLWNNGNKVQYIKISNTPLIGANIGPVIDNSEWIEFSMVEARDKNGNYLYPNSPTTAQNEKYVIDKATDKGSYNSVIINSDSSETSKAITANNTDPNTGFVYLDKQYNIDQDCNPILNNVIESRTNEWLQDVDYSVDAITPLNFDQLITFTATKASVPQSNYTQLSSINSRYVGSSTTRENINKFNDQSTIDLSNNLIYGDDFSFATKNKGKGAPLGKIPNVELNNAYIAYFNKIIDPYPVLNNKTAYYIKYLIDDSGNILDPNLSEINFSILKDTFLLKDYDSFPTRANISLTNIEENKELSKLTSGSNYVYKVGKYPSPILYTQTSSLDYTNEISLSGSRFYSALGLNDDGSTKDFINYGVNISSIQTDAVAATNKTIEQEIKINELTWNSGDITPFETNTVPNIPVSGLYPDYVILFPNNSFGEGVEYRVEGNFTFTTSTIPAEYSGKDSKKNYLDFYDKREPYRKTQVIKFDLTPYKKPISSADNISNYTVNTEGFNIKNVTLTITVDPGGANEDIKSALKIEAKPRGYSNQWVKTTSGFSLTPDSLYIEDLIIKNFFNQNNVKDVATRRAALNLIAGGWATDGGDIFGYGGKAVKYDWNIEFEFTNLQENSGLYLKANSDILVSQSGAKHGFFSQRPDDVFLFYGANGEAENNLQWKRTFTPTYQTGVNPKPVLKLKVTTPLAEDATTNKAAGPFWRRNNTPNELYMESSILNQTYGLPYIQAKLQYNGGRSTDFPLTVEPDFIEFDPVTDFWELQEGDEIRFENDEELVYTITSINGEKAITTPSESSDGKLKIVVSPPFTDDSGNIINRIPTNFDFFVIRRWKENKNFVILDQQMVYGFSSNNPSIAASGNDILVGVDPVLRSSSPGILLPENRVDKFNTKPDLVIKDLVEKNII